MTFREIYKKNNSVRMQYIARVSEELNRNSILFVYSGLCSWPDILEKEFSLKQSDKEVFFTDSDSPERYLIETFAGTEEKHMIRPMTNLPAFVAGLQNNILHDSVIVAKTSSRQSAKTWKLFAEAYLNERAGSNNAKFVIDTKNASELAEKLSKDKGSSPVILHDFEGPFDNSLFYMEAVSSLNMDVFRKKYMIKLFEHICENDYELADRCAGLSRREDFLTDPEKAVSNMFHNEDGTVSENIPEKMKQKIWLSQIELAFPMLEDLRITIIERCRKPLSNIRSIHSQTGELIKELQDVEYAQLYLFMHRLGLSNEEMGIITFLRNIRNKLSHNKIVAFSEMERLFVEYERKDIFF